MRPPVDYHREKYGVVALAEYLVAHDRWERVRLSVPAVSLHMGNAETGIEPPLIDADRDAVDPTYKYNFYTDTGGIDLVAWRGEETLVVEAKGRSAKPHAAIEQLVGRIILLMDPAATRRRYAILIPDLPNWTAIASAASHPALNAIEIFLVSAGGDIRRGAWHD